MKKNFLLAVTAVTLLAACNGNKQSGNETNDSTAVAELTAEAEAEPKQEYDLKALAKVIDGAETVMGFCDGRASVENKDGKLGVIDKKGNVIIPFEYNYSVFSYTDGVICCVKNAEDLWCYFDHDGKKLFETHDGGPSQFSEGFACKYSSDNDKYYFIDKEGKQAFGGKMWRWAENFSDGMALVFDGNGWGFINQKGEQVIPCKYESRAEENPESFHEGLALVVVNPARERMGFIDKTGKLAFDREFNTAFSFSEGLASVYDNELDRWGYIDKTGKTVITLDKGVAGRDFSEGLAMIHHWGTPIGYIDKTGKMVIKFEENQYKDGHPFHEGRARVWDGNHDGFIDTTGKLVIPCEYSCCGDFNEGIVSVLKSGKYGYIDLNGNSTFDY
ncbi:MAG: WG repeat-containing protein [Bacteroidaceae bacterium]|nr:WG repeat-containing protein [Bacteroidaceae bacterium]